VRDGKIVIRKMMNLSSSFDHRIVDGFDAASLIKTVKDRLEAPTFLVS
jgi:2-oxoisovalerate dehydrogenase E2 component (dihydrolipoyl transacylase)